MEFDHYYKTIYTYTSNNNIFNVDLYEGSIENNAQLHGSLFSSSSFGTYDTRCLYSTLNSEVFMVLAEASQSGSFLQKKSPNNLLTTSISIHGFTTNSVGYIHL